MTKIIFSLFALLLYFKSSEASNNLSINIRVTKNNGLELTQCLIYKVENDTLYTVREGLPINTSKKADYYGREKDSVLDKQFLEPETILKLRNVVSKIDSLGEHFTLCQLIEQGNPSFFIRFIYNGATQEGYISGVYRKDLFDVIDILNHINKSGPIIVYDRAVLIQYEKDCNPQE